jgi:hypothetical protein
LEQDGRRDCPEGVYNCATIYKYERLAEKCTEISGVEECASVQGSKQSGGVQSSFHDLAASKVIKAFPRYVLLGIGPPQRVN